jgi:SAM-dependent methyltransferase
MSKLTFAARATTPELMDTEHVSFEDFRACLEDLARVNRWTRTHAPTLSFLARLIRAVSARARRRVHIVDVGSGYGDLLRAIDRWAERRGIPVVLTGVDLNPWSTRAAEEASGPRRAIRWVTADALAYDPPEGIDVVVSSFFTHHLSDAQVVEFLRWMERRARLGWFVNDLQRHALPYHVFRRWAGLAGYHRFVQHDGLVSITRAFRRDDWRRFLDTADIAADEARVRWRMPFRLTVERIRART